MDLMTQCRQLAQGGRPDEAAALIEREAAAGNPEALFISANWRLWGVHGPRDLDEGHRLLDRAVSAGYVDAIRLKSNLLGNGTGVATDFDTGRTLLRRLAPRDPEAARVEELLEAMRGWTPPVAQILSTDPFIRLYKGAFSAAECAYLTERARPALRPSMVRNPQTGRGMLDPIRTSMGMYFDPTLEDLAVRAINLRLAVLSGTDVDCAEMLHVLRYRPGDEYRPHIDARPRSDNQRQTTALIYLNEGYAGGETRFVDLDIAVQGRTGDCLVFVNADAEGRPDERMRHAGLPVRAGEKWLASRWIRQYPHNPMTDI